MRVVNRTKKFVRYAVRKKCQSFTSLLAQGLKTPGVLSVEELKFANAIAKRFTVSLEAGFIQGVLFLTAGYGTRAEPLSFSRPKALLPWGNTTLLGNLIKQFAKLDLEIMAFNASRCRQLILQEADLCWPGHKKMLFEHRPLGLPGTLVANRELFQGHWIISNTDIVLDIPLKEMIEFHITTGSKWTVLTGKFPEYGHYGSLFINGIPRHYLGISIISPEVVAIAAAEQLSTGFFTKLRGAAKQEGIEINEFFTHAKWLDMGEVDLFRKHLLFQSRYIHPSAEVNSSSVLEGFYWIGSSCIIGRRASLRNSVMLDGSVLLPEAVLYDNVLPWFTRRS